MNQSRGIPQSEYDEAVDSLVASLNGPLDLEAFRTVYLLHRVAAAAREFAAREALDPFALSWTQFDVLWNIWIFGEREAGYVSRAAMVSKSGLTSIFSRLEQRGLIARRVDSEDRRRILVALTAEGIALMRDVFSRLNVADSKFASALDADQKRKLIGLLEVLLNGPHAQDRAY